MDISRELYSASQVAVRDCMGLQAGERVAVIHDQPCRRIGEAIFQADARHGQRGCPDRDHPRKTKRRVASPEVAQVMLASTWCSADQQVLDAPPTPSGGFLTGRARRDAAAGVTEDICRCMNADLSPDRCAHQQARRDDGKDAVIRVSSPAGTDITIAVKGRESPTPARAVPGEGEGGNLPTGGGVSRSSGARLARRGRRRRLDGRNRQAAGALRITVRDGYAEEVDRGR